jgi:hypothetical protein
MLYCPEHTEPVNGWYELHPDDVFSQYLDPLCTVARHQHFGIKNGAHFWSCSSKPKPQTLPSYDFFRRHGAAVNSIPMETCPVSGLMGPGIVFLG